MKTHRCVINYVGKLKNHLKLHKLSDEQADATYRKLRQVYKIIKIEEES